MTVKELPTELPAPLSRFTIFPDGLRKLDQELFELCASCYESPSSRETLDELCSSSGLIYLKHLQGQIKLMGPEAHKKLALMMDEHFKAAPGRKCPCFALAWGKDRCNYGPCKLIRDHSGPTPEQTNWAKGYAQSVGFPPSWSAWQAANPRA